MPENKKSLGALIVNGLWGENALMTMALGICPAVAVTTTGINGLAIGLATAAVLVCSNLVISILRGLIVDQFRKPFFAVIVATFAALAQMAMKLWYPAISADLGIFLPLIAVNGMILMRAHLFAGENGPVATLADSIGMGLGYVCAMTLMGVIRELFAYGTAFGKTVFSAGFEPNALALLPAGGFMLLGLLMGIYNCLAGKRSNGKEGPTT